MPKTLADHLAPDQGPKRILSLDGGGVKGILTLGMLAALEKELRRRSGDPNFVLSDYYDLIGGTSTGAIIATGLALGRSVADMTTLYADLGPVVFKKAVGTGLFLKSKYDHRALTNALTPVLRDIQLGDAENIKTGLSIHAKRIDTGSAWVLTNHPDSPYFNPQDAKTIPNRYYQLIDLVRASAAAPTFFDEVKINTEFDKKMRPVTPGYFVDGAVSANNNPSIQLLLTALVPQYGFKWTPGADQLMMTSFGTGMRRPTARRRWFDFQLTALKAIAALRAMIYDTQIQGVMAMQAMSRVHKPWTVNSEIGDMAGSPFTGAAVMDYQRIDVRLDVRRKPPRGERPTPAPVEALLGRDLAPNMLEELDQLANGDPANIALLLEIGQEAGKTFVDHMYPDPKFDLPAWSKAQA
ncbi:MAG: hypothetical protein GC189_05620 [Alphaproteobacteria bacterium]|nr:hypothetical protein [Alphaproteobacteria bacterium]